MHIKRSLCACPFSPSPSPIPFTIYLSQISVISLRAVSAPIEKSVPGTLLEIVAGNTTFKRTVRVILNNPPCKEGNVRFTMVPFKHFTVYRVERAPCVHLSNKV